VATAIWRRTGTHREVDTGHRGERAGPRAGGVDDGVRREVAHRRPNARDASIGTLIDPGDARVPVERGAAPLGVVEVAAKDLQRPDRGVARAPRGRHGAVEQHVRVEPCGLLGRELDGLGQPARVLDGARGTECVARGIVVGEEEVPDRAHSRITAGIVGETAQLLAREQREPHVDGGRELRAEATRGAPGAAGARRRGGVDDRDARAARGEVPGHARADDAGADDEDVRGGRHGGHGSVGT
jgi:hypothetical protein